MKEITRKYFEGQASETELKALYKWLRNKENRLIFHRVKAEWKNSLEKEQFHAGGEESWNRLQEQLWQSSYNGWQRSRKIQQIFRLAAIFFFLVSLGSLALYFKHLPVTLPEITSTVIAENGQISKVELPDGSVAWLNSGSKMTYSNYFSAENRNVTLEGEAFFDVKKNEELPLIVDCGSMKVKVLGTRFNVNSYTPENSVETILENGNVELLTSKSSQTFYKMKPGERVNVNTRENTYAAEMVNTARYTSWKDGILNIYNLPITEVAERLEKRYNQKFLLTPEVKNLRYTFSIEHEKLEDILQLMERITPVKAVQEEEVITIKGDIKRMREAGG